MLLGVDPLLGPELLATLRAMGHGDEIAIVDANYPAVEHGSKVIRADGVPIAPMISAILSVLPVDDFVEEAIFRSLYKGDQPDILPVHEAMIAAISKHVPDRTVFPLAGKAFYDRVRSAHAIVATGERSLYANLIIRKGVIYPDSASR